MLSVALGESTMSRTQVQLWYNRFKKGREDFIDDARPGRQSTLTTDEPNHYWKIEDDVGIPLGSCQAIFTDILGMKRAAAKIVPKLLNFEQKYHRMDIVQEMLMTFNDDPDPIMPMEASRRANTEKSSSSSIKC